MAANIIGADGSRPPSSQFLAPGKRGEKLIMSATVSLGAGWRTTAGSLDDGFVIVPEPMSQNPTRRLVSSRVCFRASVSVHVTIHLLWPIFRPSGPWILLLPVGLGSLLFVFRIRLVVLVVLVGIPTQQDLLVPGWWCDSNPSHPFTTFPSSWATGTPQSQWSRFPIVFDMLSRIIESTTPPSLHLQLRFAPSSSEEGYLISKTGDRR